MSTSLRACLGRRLAGMIWLASFISLLSLLVECPFGTRVLCYAQSQAPLQLAIHDGQVDARELYDAVAADLHWIPAAVAKLTQELSRPSDSSVPSPTLNLQPAWLSVEDLSQWSSLFPQVFSVREASVESPAMLMVDRQQLQQLLAEKKQAFRYRLARAAGIEIASVSRVEATWANRTEPPQRIVVILHGIHSTSTASEQMALSLHEHNTLPMLLFNYPNDAPVIESAHWLVQELANVTKQFPEARLSVIGYSLGSLVARAALEMPAFQQAVAELPVDQLILVCPPNHGSALWEYAPLLEGAEILQRFGDQDLVGRPVRRIVRGLVDGLNEASADLNPESPLLQELHRQARHPQVRYSIIAGDQGPLRPATAKLLQLGLQQWQAAAENGPLVSRLAAVSQMAELHRGQGDGVVTVESTRLSGVDDWEVLPIEHLSWGKTETLAGRQLSESISRRLVAPQDSTEAPATR